MTPERRFFLSYSRQELYYAQAVVEALQKRGQPVWFDLQQIEPGSRWKDEIANGLSTATDLILIVSKASIRSPWVALEWQQALADGRPVHLLLFDAVSTAPYTVPADDDSPLAGQTIDLPALFERAATLTDGRGRFGAVIERLLANLTSPTPRRDPLPAPNRFGIPTRSSPVVLFVALSLLLMVGLSGWVTVTHLSRDVFLFLTGLATTAYYGVEAVHFLRRESFRGARTALLIAPVLVGVFVFPLMLVYIGAAWLIHRHPDIHRISPLGEGLFNRRGAPRNLDRPGDLLVWLLCASVAFVFIEPLIALLAAILVVIGWPVVRIKPYRPKPIRTDSTYRVFSAAADATVANEIRAMMQESGHMEVTDDDIDNAIILLSNATPPSAPLPDLPPTARVVVVLATLLEAPDQYAAHLPYQWVDYRRRDIDRLRAMAYDLLPERLDGGNSFASQIVPQWFGQAVLPRAVEWYLGFQFLYLTLFFIGFARSWVQTGELGNDAPAVALGLAVVVLGVWVSNRVHRREITVWQMLLFGLLPVAMVLLRAVPSSPQTEILIAVGIAALLAFFFGRAYLRMTLGFWLPARGLAIPKRDVLGLRRDARLWRRNLLSVGMAVLITLSLAGREVPRDIPNLPLDQIRYTLVPVTRTQQLAVPTHWVVAVDPSNIDSFLRDVPLSAALRRVDGPLAEPLADNINGIFQGGLEGGGVLGRTGAQFASILEGVGSALDNGLRWSPYRLGVPAQAWVYAEMVGDMQQTLVMQRWQVPPNPVNGLTVGRWADMVRREGRSGRSIVMLADQTRRVLGWQIDDLTFDVRGEDEIPMRWRVVFYDGASFDFYVTFSGDPDVLTRQLPVIDQIIGAGQSFIHALPRG